MLSDAELALTHALRLPTMTVADHVLIARLAWIQRDGVIEDVVYPVFPPDRNAADMLERVQRASVRALVIPNGGGIALIGSQAVARSE